MNGKSQIIEELFNFSPDIRYVAVYQNNDLLFKQRAQVSNASSEDSDRYEELLVNPVLLTAAKQRGEIDCGGLRFLIVAYGNFYQLIREIQGGHISICLDKSSDLTSLPERINVFLKSKQW